MNKLESTIYGLVRKNPTLKQFVRNMYQGVFDLLPKRKISLLHINTGKAFSLGSTMLHHSLMMRQSCWRIKINLICVCLYLRMGWMSDILIWSKVL